MNHTVRGAKGSACPDPSLQTCGLIECAKATVFVLT